MNKEELKQFFHKKVLVEYGKIKTSKVGVLINIPRPEKVSLQFRRTIFDDDGVPFSFITWKNIDVEKIRRIALIKNEVIE